MSNIQYSLKDFDYIYGNYIFSLNLSLNNPDLYNTKSLNKNFT